MSDDLDPSSFLGDPTVQEQAAAYSAALRKQQYDAGLLHVFGNKGLSDLGSSMSGQAQDALTDMRTRDSSQGALLMKSLGLGRKKVLNLRNGKSVSYDPLTGQAEELEDGLGDAASKVMNAGDHSTISVGPDGKVTKLVDAPPPKPHGGGGVGDGVEKGMWGKFIHDINPSTGRSGEMGKNQARINAAIRVEKLIQDPTGAVRDLDPREMPELATSLQSLLSPGGHSQAEVQHLIPETLRGNAAKVIEWLTNEPTGTGQRAFVEKMGHTVAREKEAALQALHESQYAVIPGYSPLFKQDRARAEGVMRGQGLDPSLLDGNFVYRKAAPASAPGAAASVHTPQEIAAAKAWLAKPENANHPKRAQVQALVGGQ